MNSCWKMVVVAAAALGLFATVSSAAPLQVNANIPFAFISRSSRPSREPGGYYPDTDAPGSLIEIGGRPQLRHLVSNFAEVLEKFEGRRHTLALGTPPADSRGDGVRRRELRDAFPSDRRRRPPDWHEYGMKLVSGVTLYRVRDGVVDSGEFIRLDTSPAASSH
ncbi:MAG TPA: hypothetical protein VLK65_00430 [Vicinamibacteria bacterium]|nr:hypothetical protein [Vicinamibacteria bacterium]